MKIQPTAFLLLTGRTHPTKMKEFGDSMSPIHMKCAHTSKKTAGLTLGTVKLKPMLPCNLLMEICGQLSMKKPTTCTTMLKMIKTGTMMMIWRKTIEIHTLMNRRELSWTTFGTVSTAMVTKLPKLAH